jgi:hypothetical protein
MKATVAVLALLLALSSPAFANPWDLEHGNPGWSDDPGNYDEDHGPYDHAQGYEGHPTLFGGYEEEFWDGDCRIEREWEGDGDYREERDCHGH